MKTLAKKCLAGILGVLFMGCLSVSWGQAREIGYLNRIQGKAEITRPPAKSPRSAHARDLIRVGDRLETLQESKAWWSLHRSSSDKNDASLGEYSQLSFSGYDREKESSSVSLEVSAGLVRFIKVLPASSPESSFMVTTPTALAWVDTPEEPADFVVESLSPEMTVITVIWGTVSVRNVAQDISAIRTLHSCETVTVEENQEPSEVRRVSSDTLKSLIERTTIPGTLPTDVPSCEQATEPPEPPPGPPPGPTVCPECFIWDGTSCIPQVCPPGSVFDLNAPGCCKGPPICGKCEYWDAVEQMCVQQVCPPGSVFDLNAPGCCKGPPICGKCEHWDAVEQMCVKQVCPPGSVFDLNAPGCCKGPPVCGKCEHWDAVEQMCVPNESCKGNFKFYPDGGPNGKCCECPYSSTNLPPNDPLCHQGDVTHFNPATCSCTPEVKSIKCKKTCPPGQQLDEVHCTCIPGPPPFVPTCDKRCPPGQHLNLNTCSCEPGPCNKTCPPDSTLDRARCECMPKPCHIRSCPQGQTFDREKCKCVPKPCDKTCPSGQRLDLARCQCISPPCTKRCDPDLILDRSTCTCVARKDRDRKTCKKSCPSGTRLNPSTCQCIRTEPVKKPKREDVKKPKPPQPRPQPGPTPRPRPSTGPR